MQRTAKLDKVTVPYVTAMQRQQKPWAYSWGAAPPQQRQLHPSVCDPSASQREHASFVTSSSPGVCRTWYTSGFGGGGSTTQPSYQSWRRGIWSFEAVWRIYDCGSTADYCQHKKRPPPNTLKNCCVCTSCGWEEHVAAHCTAERWFEGQCNVCGKRRHASRHCQLRHVSGIAKRAVPSQQQQQQQLAEAARSSAVDELGVVERGLASRGSGGAHERKKQQLSRQPAGGEIAVTGAVTLGGCRGTADVARGA